MARYHDDKSKEAGDAGMMPHHGGAHANMPTEVVFKSYSNVGATMPDGLDDTVRGVDSQIGADEGKLHSKLSPKKV